MLISKVSKLQQKHEKIQSMQKSHSNLELIQILRHVEFLKLRILEILNFYQYTWVKLKVEIGLQPK